MTHSFPVSGQPPAGYVHFLMVICSALISTSFTVGAAISPGLDPAVLTLVRFVTAVCLFAPYVRYRYGFQFSWDLFGRSAVISLCLVVFFWCMFFSLRFTTALNTSVIYTLVPSLSGVYAAVWLHERLHASRIAALLLGMAGAVWVIFRGDMSLLGAMVWNRGDLVFFGGCLAMAAYPLAIRSLHRGEAMAVMTFWILVTGSLWLMIIAGYRLPRTNWGVVSTFVWAGIAYLAVFTTIVTFFLTQYAVIHIGPTRVISYSYLYPGFVLLIDWIFGRGWPEPIVLPGVLVVISAVLVLQIKRPD